VTLTATGRGRARPLTFRGRATAPDRLTQGDPMFRTTKRRGRSLAVATLAVAALGLVACGSDQPEGGGGVGPKEIKLLVSAPLTGDYAETGEDMVNGAKLAADHLNEQGGVASGPLKGAKFVIESADDELSTEAATTLASRYVDDGSIWALMGYLPSGQAQAAGVVTGRADLPVFSSFSCADFLTEDVDNIVVECASLDNIARAATDFAVTELGAKRVGSIAADFSLLESYYKGIDSQLEATGATNASRQVYPEGTADFATPITNLDAANVDVVLSGAYQADSGRILAQMRRAGMTVPYVDFLGEGWGETFMETAGPAASRDAYSFDAANTSDDASPFVKEMSDEFQKRFGKKMPSAAMHTFDTVLTVAATIEAGATNRGELLDHIQDATGEGIVGPIDFNEELRPASRVGFVFGITGPKLADRKVVAEYDLKGDRTVERVDR